MKWTALLLLLVACREPDAIDGELYVLLGKKKPVTHVDSLVFRAYDYGHDDGYAEGYSVHVCVR